MPVILVVRILHRVLLFAPAHDYCPLLVVGAADNQPDVCLLFYDEDAFLGHGDNVDLLYAVAPLHIDIPEDDALGDCLDSFCGVLLADVSHNLVLEEPHAKDDSTEYDYKRYHVIEYILLYLVCVKFAHTIFALGLVIPFSILQSAFRIQL